MCQPCILVPGAVQGWEYEGVVWGDREWRVVLLPISHPDGMDAINATILAKAVGDLPDGSQLLFRAAVWDSLPDGVPPLPAEWQHRLLPGGVMDGSNVLDLMLAALEPGSEIEFRVSGPETSAILERIHQAFKTINARKPL